ncbi:TPA: hypothetical protein ACH3X1_013371 [Trebouxia sp. C0004]
MRSKRSKALAAVQNSNPFDNGVDLTDQPQASTVNLERHSDVPEDSRRGRPEEHEAAQYPPVPTARPPRIKTLVVRQRDLPQQQTQSLSRSALELLPFLCEHSAEFADKLLRVIKDPSFDTDSVPWRSAKDLHSCLDTAQASRPWLDIVFCSVVAQSCLTLHIALQVWEYVPPYQETLPGYDEPVTFYAHIRKDRHLLLQAMLNSPEAAVRSGMFHSSFVLGLLFYSDATEAKRKGHKFHPLSVYIANFPLDALRSQNGFRRIAHLPILQGSDFTHLTKDQCQYEADCLACYSGFYMRCCDGCQRHFVPVPAAYVADIKEANEVFNIAPYPAYRSDIGTVITRDKLSDPDYVAPARTEKLMKEILYEVKVLQQTDSVEAAKLMKEWSLSIDELTALIGFAYVEDAYGLYYNDRLHQSNRGLAEDQVRFLHAMLKPAELAKLNGYLQSMPSFPGFKVPSFGLMEKEKSTATEQANLFKLLPVALFVLPRVNAVFGLAMQELLRFQTLRDLEQHTEKSLSDLDKARKRTQNLCKDNLITKKDGETVSMSAVGFCNPKFNLMQHWPGIIVKFGSANLTSTGETAAAMVASSQLVPIPQATSRSAAQKAADTGRPYLTGFKTVMAYTTPGDVSALQQKLGNSEDMLQLFHRALGIALGAPTACNFAELPKTPTGTPAVHVKVATGLGLAHQLHRGSSLEGITLHGGDSHFHCVKIKGPGKDTWYAQLLLLFSYADADGLDHDVAFVRWFKAFTRRPKHAIGCKLQPMRWEVCKPRGWSKEGPRTDIISLDQIVGPCYIQQDSADKSVYWTSPYRSLRISKGVVLHKLVLYGP